MLEFAFEARVEVAPPLVIGPTPHGERRMVPILGGVFEGPGLRGRILAGGADWQILRPDGVTELYARYLMETDSGAIIQVINRGLRHGPGEVMERLRSGLPVDPSRYYFRASTVFEAPQAAAAEAPGEFAVTSPGTPHEFAALNRSIFVATGERHPAQVVVRFWKLL
jgi:hypothetical protein